MSCDITTFFNLHLFVQDSLLKTVILKVAPLSTVTDAKVKMPMLASRQKGKQDSITQEKSKMMFSQGQCRPSMKKGKSWKGGGGVAEHHVVLPSCLHSIAEAVNCKELKHIGHHLRHPSFQKLPLFTPLHGEEHSSLPCLPMPLVLSLWR